MVSFPSISFPVVFGSLELNELESSTDFVANVLVFSVLSVPMSTNLVLGSALLVLILAFSVLLIALLLLELALSVLLSARVLISPMSVLSLASLVLILDISVRFGTRVGLVFSCAPVVVKLASGIASLVLLSKVID